MQARYIGSPNGIRRSVFPPSALVTGRELKKLIQHSLNFVSNNHVVWGIDRKKPSKRFGNLIRSPKSRLNDMLIKHQDEAQEFILARVGTREPAAEVKEE